MQAASILRFLAVTDEAFRWYLSDLHGWGGARLSWVAILLLEDETCFFWPSILIAMLGKRIRKHLWKPVGDLSFRLLWSVLGSAMADTFGCFSRRRFRREWPATAGRFRLNEALPIPFDGHGKMEVDLCCADAKVVIELDRPQHLADSDAYRRDRRKDAILQEHGYFVIRFLTADVGKNLDSILDNVIRVLTLKNRG